MNTAADVVDTKELVEVDRKHMWHHLTPHKPLETKDPSLGCQRKRAYRRGFGCCVDG